MRTSTTTTLFLAVLTSLTGCTSPPKGVAYGREEELRRQLAETRPMRDYGYTIKDLRFTPDYKKALVVFIHTDSNTRPEWEFVLIADEFGRYRGMNMQPFYTPGTANTPSIQLTIALPVK